MNKKKILFAIPSLDQRGPDRVFFELINNLDHHKFNCILAVQEKEGYYLQSLSDKVDCHILNNSQKKYPFTELRSLILQEKPDVILSTLRMILTSTIATIGITNPPIHIIRPANNLTLNGLYLIKQSPLKHTFSFILDILTLWLSDFVVCQSKKLQDDLSRYASLKNKSIVINNPIDITQVAKNAQRENITLKGKPSILAIGRLYRQKGFDLLIQSIANIVNDYPHLHLTILGEGPERSHLESLVIENNLKNNISLLGFCSNPYAYIRNCDFVVSASRYEGFPNVLLESIALGKPVLATNCPGGTSDIVIPKLTGWLTETENITAMSENLKKAIKEFPSMDSEEIIDFCNQNFSVAKITEEYEITIEKLLVL